MNPDPISDVVAFLQQPGWTTGIFWLLALASVAIAVYAFSTIPSQRRVGHICDWAFRFLIGCMWWQQTLWKLPPTYTDLPDGSGGLRYWVSKMLTGAAFSWHSDLVQNVVLPGSVGSANGLSIVRLSPSVRTIFGDASRSAIVRGRHRPRSPTAGQ